MNRRELFATLGAIVGAALGNKVVGSDGHWIAPIADIANRPEDAQRIFEFVANTSCQYTGVAYVELNDPTVIISGDCGTAKSSVLITPTSIRYRTITNRGQEIIHDAKTQKVIDFIRTLGYDFQ